MNQTFQKIIKVGLTIMLFTFLQQGLAKTKSIYDPISINYLYPIKPEPVLPAFDDSLGYHSLDFSFNLVHKDSFIPGMGRGAWLTLGGGLDYGYMWNLYDSDNYMLVLEIITVSCLRS